MVIVPDQSLFSSWMNPTNTTEGAYVGSNIYTGTDTTYGSLTVDGDSQTCALTLIENAFGESHILEHKTYLHNAVSSGHDSASAWYARKVDLMNEAMVYGWSPFEDSATGTSVPAAHTIDKTQLPLFAHEPSRITISAYWWLRSVVSSTSFAIVGYGGYCNYNNASNVNGVRPDFLKPNRVGYTPNGSKRKELSSMP